MVAEMIPGQIATPIENGKDILVLMPAKAIEISTHQESWGDVTHYAIPVRWRKPDRGIVMANLPHWLASQPKETAWDLAHTLRRIPGWRNAEIVAHCEGFIVVRRFVSIGD